MSICLKEIILFDYLNFSFLSFASAYQVGQFYNAVTTTCVSHKGETILQQRAKLSIGIPIKEGDMSPL